MSRVHVIAVSPTGVAHRAPLVEDRTLCGRTFPTLEHPGYSVATRRLWHRTLGQVTCSACLALQRCGGTHEEFVPLAARSSR
jgi:hypothetical protein